MSDENGRQGSKEISSTVRRRDLLGGGLIAVASDPPEFDAGLASDFDQSLN